MTVYALDQVALFVGNREMTGAGEDGFIEINKISEEWENTAMADGQIVSAKNLDRSAIALITLRYDSPGNQILQRFAEARATVNFSCTWPNGDSVDTEEARVQDYPDIADGVSPGTRQWQVFLANAEYAFAVGA